MVAVAVAFSPTRSRRSASASSMKPIAQPSSSSTRCEYESAFDAKVRTESATMKPRTPKTAKATPSATKTATIRGSFSLQKRSRQQRVQPRAGSAAHSVTPAQRSGRLLSRSTTGVSRYESAIASTSGTSTARR